MLAKFLAVAGAVLFVGVVAALLGKTLIPLGVTGLVIYAAYCVAKNLAD